MDFDEDKIRRQVIAGLATVEPWRIELEEIDYGAKLGVFYRSKDGIKRAVTETKGKTEDQIAFALLSQLMNRAEPILSPYEGKTGRHPDTCTCSKHKAVNGAQAA